MAILTTTGQADASNPIYQYFTMEFSLHGALTAGATDFVYPDNSAAGATDAQFQVCPFASTLVRAYGYLKAAPGAGNECVVTINQDTVGTTSTFTITNPAVSANDVTHTVAFAAGEKVSVETTNTDVGGAFAAEDLSVTLLFRRAMS